MDRSASDEELADAILLVSRAMLGVAVRSLSAADVEITLPQYRTLVVLVEGGSFRLADLAEHLAVSPSTATRMCDRLVRKGLVTRNRDGLDRREVGLDATDEGRRLVEAVMERRRQEVGAMADSIPAASRGQLVSSLQLLARAAGELPEMQWEPGWREEPGPEAASEGGSAGAGGVTPASES